MRIWIDLANSPHVLFFRPIIGRLKAGGHEVLLTARDFAQTLPLCRRFGLEHEVIGGHGGANRLRKLANIAGRVWGLRRWAKAHGPFDLAVSHNSYAHCAAARSLGIRTATLMDYEHTPANHLAFRAAHRVIVPEAFPEESLRRFGARPGKCRRYRGVKEEVYLAEAPDPAVMAKARAEIEALAGRALDKVVLVTVRPPATMALYHGFENPFFDELLDYLSARENVVVILSARTREQREALAGAGRRNVLVPEHALDGRAVIEYSDAMIGAGGTMNREAAVLGTPAYTLFAGEMGAVDRWLIERGRMVDLAGPLQAGRPPREVFTAIKLEKKQSAMQKADPRVLDEVVGLILEAADGK